MIPGIVKVNNKYIRLNTVVLNMEDINGNILDIRENIDIVKRVDAYLKYLYHEGFISNGQPYMINYKDVISCSRFSLKHYNI